MPKSGTVYDSRPWFALAASGQASVIPTGMWAYRGNPAWVCEVPGVARVWEVLDELLKRRLGSHRVLIYGRDEDHGIDHTIRSYAAVREVGYVSCVPDRTAWREKAVFRRDLEMVSQTNAVVWFGPEESDGDVARIAQILGIDVRIVPTVQGLTG